MMQCKLTAFLIAVFKVLGLRPHLNFEGKKLERDQGDPCVCRKYQSLNQVDRYGVEKVSRSKQGIVKPLLHCGYVTLHTCVYSTE